MRKAPKHEYNDEGFCGKCGLNRRTSVILPPDLSCEDIIADHEAELEFERRAS